MTNAVVIIIILLLIGIVIWMDMGFNYISGLGNNARFVYGALYSFAFVLSAYACYKAYDCEVDNALTRSMNQVQ